MPFPWKKNRVPRISQIVADLQSPKHGGSLVVETGFPTSLIDLFVKNKGRFRKHKNKKRVQVGISNPVTEAPAAPAPPPTPEPSSFSDRTVLVQSPILKQRVGEDVDVDHGVSVSGQDCDLGRESDCGSDSNTVLAAVLKIFAVVVAFFLSMNKLTAGITLSAFVLLFIECIGKRVFCCLKPCSNANRNFKSLAKKIRFLGGFKKRKGSYSAEASATPIVDEEHLDQGVELGYSPTQEIEIVESKSDNEMGIPISCEESHPAEPDFNSLEHSKLRIMEKHCDECKGKTKRSSKLKSKFVNKLVPKKLRKSNTEKKSKQRVGESSRSSIAEESVKSRRSEIGLQQNDNEIELHENGNRSLSLLARQLEFIQDDDEVDNGIACSNQSPLQEKDDRVAVSNSGYIILLLIVLAGLVVGRFPALLLTMAWIFLLKIAKSGGISVKLPLFRFSVPICWKKKNI